MSKETRWQVMYYIINEYDDKEWHELDVFASDWNDALIKTKNYLDKDHRFYCIYSAREMTEKGEYV